MADLTENLNGYESCELFKDDLAKVKKVALNLDGFLIDIILYDYSDKQFLVITQFEKLGTFILVTKGTARNLNGASEIYDVKTLCGTDNEEYHLAARYLAQQLQIQKPVLFSICLKNYTLKILQSIVKVLKEQLCY